ncbi:uncharacterized protein LOC105230529 [Bactrocera dorsalis]|uniref:Uncharacterized protein LOC105230529 n=1 Tax=Bactrocera dorsalis TaxID=27457 RepID=A0A6I9VHD0_BACDO|nr:uncharacterized protein LOC105230529 [Bactrocera dorsalis]
MTGVCFKYLAALLLVVGIVCINADDTENPETDADIFVSRDRLLNFIYNEDFTLNVYVLKRSEELCNKISDDDLNTLAYKNKTSEASDESEALDTRETLLRKCVRRLMARFDLTGNHNDREDLLLLKYGFEDIGKDVYRKYEEFFEVILRRIDKYLKRLAPEQQSKQMAQNLKGWSSKIRDASTLAGKEMEFLSFMRFYLFKEGV